VREKQEGRQAGRKVEGHSKTQRQTGRDRQRWAKSGRCRQAGRQARVDRGRQARK
jgi:hypothetical protein